jgi:hypothetical protein
LTEAKIFAGSCTCAEPLTPAETWALHSNHTKQAARKISKKKIDLKFSALNVLDLALAIHFTPETSSSVDLCFTAMSIKASDARLITLSLRKTSARSRRT